MPTKRTRLTICLTDSSNEYLCRLSESQGVSKSAVINELFRLMGPSLTQLAAAREMMDQGFKTASHGAFNDFLDKLNFDMWELTHEAREEHMEKLQDENL